MDRSAFRQGNAGHRHLLDSEFTRFEQTLHLIYKPSRSPDLAPSLGWESATI
jgi:hypothetical protein